MAEDLAFREELSALSPYEPGKPISEVKEELNLEDVIKLASNESPYPPFEAAQKAIVQAMGELNRYPDGACTALKRKLGPFLGFPVENIAIGNGSNELIRIIAMALISGGDEVVMATPSFVIYPTVTKLMGGKCREVELRDFRHDLPAMLKEVTDRTRIVFVCNPNNPTGTIVYRDELDAFLDSLPARVLPVLDEAYFEFVEDPKFPDGLDYFREGRNVVVLRTFSKIYGLAGCRIGYAVGSKQIVDAINKVRDPFNVNVLAQAAALASLDEQDEVERRKKLNLEAKKYLYDELDGMAVPFVPSQSNFIFVRVGQNSRDVFNRLLREGVIVRSGDAFGYDSYIRVTIGSPAENAKFVSALRKVLRK
jgi:histidinol-phosphate aminotransferase